MVDISKYLEYQLKMKITSQNKKEAKKADETPSQQRQTHSHSTYRESDEDSDEYTPNIQKLNSKQSLRIGKSKDDGSIAFYNARIKEWKSKFKDKIDPECGTSSQSMDVLGLLRKQESFQELRDGFKIPNFVWNNLYKYQKTGVKWLWELHQIESGGLLGDEMGLGKTVQIIAFLAGISFTGLGFWGGLGPTLVVAPATVVHQWVRHFHEWWPPVRVAVLHQSGSYTGSADKLIKDINNSHGVLITTYAGLVKHRLSLEFRKWHYMILDEGHKIRNADTQVSKAVKKMNTPHRIVITGSPLQNSLQELWSLFDYMSPGLLGSLPAFMEHFAIPITQGGYTNATKVQEALALSLAIALKDTITPYMLRRTKAEVQDHLKLPDKSEQILFCSLASEQKELYKSYLMSENVRGILDKESRFGVPMRARILVAISVLRKICNHPDLYLYSFEEDFPEDGNDPIYLNFGFWRRAGKMIVINSLLKIWKKQGHRVLIFTQSRSMLGVLEQFLQQCEYKYLKMDGTTTVGSRQPLINTFNSDDSYLVFLATTRVGGLGVNLTGADRVIIYDPDWNPATDSQAKERAWRIGQSRNVTVYRLLSAGTIEEKIYQRQVFKQLLSNKVLLNPNQKNYLKTSTLQGLFSLEEPDKEGVTETTNIFKHTVVEPNEKNDKNDSVMLSGGVSFSNDKMAAMRRLAQKISKTISKESAASDAKVEEEDPRERYKRKQIPPPPEPEPIPVNLIDDQETQADFSTILSEIDIVSMCSKPTRVKAIESFENIGLEIEINDREEGELDDEEEGEIKEECIQSDDIIKVDAECGSSSDHIGKRKNKKRKHKDKFSGNLPGEGDEKIEFLKKVKKFKDKHNEDKSSSDLSNEHDNYVLGKLFAKSGVQSALQHDKVIGLVEREEKHRLRTEAQEKALRALKALKKSRIRNWRY